MNNIAGFVVIACALVICSLILQPPKPSVRTTECFHVLPSHAEVNTLMVNKCTGHSWLLVRTQLSAADPKTGEKAAYTFRWYLVQGEDREPELTFKFE